MSRVSFGYCHVCDRPTNHTEEGCLHPEHAANAMARYKRNLEENCPILKKEVLEQKRCKACGRYPEIKAGWLGCDCVQYSISHDNATMVYRLWYERYPND